MPRAPKKCARPDCQARVVGVTYCPEHTPSWKSKPRTKSSLAPRSRTQRERILQRDRTCKCAGCTRCSPRIGCERRSTDDDHIVSVAEAARLGWSEAQREADANHQGLCHPCHTRKTQSEAASARRADTTPPPF